MPDVFALQASVRIAVTEAIQALERLDTKAKGTVTVFQNVAQAADKFSTKLAQSLSAASGSFNTMAAVVQGAGQQSATALNTLANNMRQAVQGATTAMSQMTSAAQGLGARLTASVKTPVQQTTVAMQQMQKATGGAGQGFQQLAAMLGSLVALRTAGTWVIEFEAGMRAVNSVLQLNEADFERFTGQVRDLAATSQSFGAGPREMATALYTITQADYDASQAMEVMAASSKAAAAGLTETRVSADAIIAVLHAYGLSANEAQKASDFLFRTVLDGNISFEDLAQKIGIVLGIANNAGVSLEELGAIISDATIKGLQGGRAITSLRQAIAHLAGETQEKQKALQQYGLTINQASIASEGLINTMKKLVEATGGNSKAMQDILGDVDAVNLVMSLAGDNFEHVTRMLENQKNAMGATDIAFAQVSKSMQFAVKEFKASLEALVETAAVKVIPTMTATLHGFTAVTEALNAQGPEALGIISKLLAALVGLAAAAWAVPKALAAVAAGWRLLAGAWASVSAIATVGGALLGADTLGVGAGATAGIAAFGGAATAGTTAATGLSAALGPVAIGLALIGTALANWAVAQRIDELDKLDAAMVKASRAATELHNSINTVDLSGYGAKIRQLTEDVKTGKVGWTDYATQLKALYTEMGRGLGGLGVTSRELAALNEQLQRGATAYEETAMKAKAAQKHLSELQSAQKGGIGRAGLSEEELRYVDFNVAALEKRATALREQIALTGLATASVATYEKGVNEGALKQAEAFNNANNYIDTQIEKWKQLKDLQAFGSNTDELRYLEKTIDLLAEAATKQEALKNPSQGGAARTDLADFLFQLKAGDFSGKGGAEQMLAAWGRVKDALILAGAAGVDQLQQMVIGYSKFLRQVSTENLLGNKADFTNELKDRVQAIKEAMAGTQGAPAGPSTKVVQAGPGSYTNAAAQNLDATFAALRVGQRLTTKEALAQMQQLLEKAKELEQAHLITSDMRRAIEKEVASLQKQTITDKIEGIKAEQKAAEARVRAIQSEIKLAEERHAPEEEIQKLIKDELQARLQVIAAQKASALFAAGPDVVKQQEAVEKAIEDTKDAYNDMGVASKKAHQAELDRLKEVVSLQNKVKDAQQTYIDRQLSRLQTANEDGKISDAQYAQQAEELIRRKLALKLEAMRAESAAEQAALGDSEEADKRRLLMAQAEALAEIEAVQDAEDTIAAIRDKAAGKKTVGGAIQTLEEAMKDLTDQFAVKSGEKASFLTSSASSGPGLSASQMLGPSLANQTPYTSGVMTDAEITAAAKARQQGVTGLSSGAPAGTTFVPGQGSFAPGVEPPRPETKHTVEVEFKASGEVKVTDPGPLGADLAKQVADKLNLANYAMSSFGGGLGRS